MSTEKNYVRKIPYSLRNMFKNCKWVGMCLWGEIGLTIPSDTSNPSKPSWNQMQSPYKDLKRAVIDVIYPKLSTSALNAPQNSKVKRKKKSAR